MDSENGIAKITGTIIAIVFDHCPTVQEIVVNKDSVAGGLLDVIWQGGARSATYIILMAANSDC